MNTLLPISTEGHLTIAIYKCEILAKSIGFDSQSISFISFAISEIGINTIRYGQNGRIYFSSTYNNRGIRIFIVDDGIGIENIKLSLKDQYSTSSNSLGVGLGAAMRSMSNFWIKSQKGKGTTVLMKKFLPLDYKNISWGIARNINKTKPKNMFNFINEGFDGNKLLLGLIKSKTPSNESTNLSEHLKSIITKNVGSSLYKILSKVRVYLIKNSSDIDFEVCLSYIKPHSISLAGVGNFFFQVIAEDQIQFQTNNNSLRHSNLDEIETFQVNTKNNSIGIISTGLSDTKAILKNPFLLANTDIANEVLTKINNGTDNFVIVSRKNRIT